MVSSGAARFPDSEDEEVAHVRGSRSSLVPWAGFIGSFFLAYILFSFVGSFFSGASSSGFKPSGGQEGDDVFAEALIVKGPSNAVRVEDSPRLTPLEGNDFLFFVWFKLRQPLDTEERVYLMGK